MLSRPPTSPAVLEYAEFRRHVLTRLGRSPTEVGNGDGDDRLELDSLDRLELLVALEDLCGASLPDELVAQIETLADAHEWYRVRAGQPTTTGADRAPEPAPGRVPLSGRRVRLRALAPPDYEWLHQLVTDEAVLVRWRDRGQTFRIEDWLDRLWAGVAAQFVVTGDGGEPLGLVTIYGHDGHNRHARLAAVFDPHTDTAGWRLEGVVLGARYAFEVFDLVKLYAEVVDFNLPSFASGLDRWFVREGLLSDHEYAHGRRWPVHVLACSRERFAEQWDGWRRPPLGSVP